MLFHSLEFAIFLPLVFGLYWFVVSRNLRQQNLLLLLASYVFYGWWDWRFLSLIIFSSATDFVIGSELHKSTDSRTRKALAGTSLLFNLGLLGYFKYANFFIDSFISAFGSIGVALEPTTLNIILPVGISFYTFQTLSYTIDIYRRKLEPEKDPVAFFAFVSFFPQLVAGPIERASNLLPQFSKPRNFSYDQAKDGLRQILWGLFKKAVIADNCGVYVNQIFSQSHELEGSVLALGVFYFAFQVYADFSGYSDIAIGTARLFGFNLLPNFRLPFFSTSIGEFWRRWHISLNTWFADYVYTPMAIGLRDWGLYAIVFALFVTFSLSGLWHGANWTYVAWGIVMSAGAIFEVLTKKRRKRLRKKVSRKVWNFLSGLATFSFICFSFIFFRADTLGQAFIYLGNLLQPELLALPHPLSLAKIGPWMLVLLGFEWVQRKHLHPLVLDRLPTPVRWCIYYALLYMLVNMGTSNQSFIYFQF
ncbi:MAG: MBOAT family O-acyltransferase [Bacteroidota bacterium]